MNRLFYGDNLYVMKDLMDNHAVDLIYLDPPFKSNKNYNLMYSRRVGRPIPEQEEAFCDTWEMDAEKRELVKAMPDLMREQGIDDYYVQFWRHWMNALRYTQPQLLAYLIYMVQRLMYMKLILKPTGSIYLHCDPDASHYIKVMMDSIFGHDNFRNEIVWKRTGSHGGANRWGPIHDTLFFYSMSDKYTWNHVYQPYDDEYVKKNYKRVDERGHHQDVSLTGAGTRNGDSGEPWRGIDPTESGRHWAVPIKSLQQAYPDLDLSGMTTVDGVMYYDLEDGDMGKMILSVKGGNMRPSDVRDLEGTRSVDDDAKLAGFISLKEPTKAMREAASEAGLWHYKGETYDRVQMLTVKDIVEDKRLFRTPARVKYRDDHLQQSLKL